MVKFAICLVHYKTQAYIETQLNSWYNFNDKEDFQIIIIDNDPSVDEPFWDDIKKKFPDIILRHHVPVDVNRTSGEHGSGLDVGLGIARVLGAKYFLCHDPDFFWVQKNLLKYFEAEFNNEGYQCIGAPYTIPLQHYDYNTPCAFGAAYQMDFLEGISFACHKDQHETMIAGKDVGWEIRKKLQETKGKHLTFSQCDVPQSELIPGEYSFQTILRQYHLFSRRIAYHLHRGSFDDGLAKFSDQNWRSDRSKDLHKPHDAWVSVRQQYCERYYKELQNSSGYL